MILINNEELKVTKFPNGEIKIEDSNIESLIYGHRTVGLIFKFETNADLMDLYFIKKHLDSKGIKEVCLKILYMPYSRMDRTEGITVFTLKYISQLINDLNFSEVFVCEPHSDVTMALLDRSVQINQTRNLFEDVKEIIDFDEENDYIYYADAGADKRYSKQIQGKNILVGNKKREFGKGLITDLKVMGDVKHKDFRVVMVDDLCSYGGTFIKGAEELRKLGAKEIILIVAHCEKSIIEGKIPDSDLIDKVYTTNSIISNGDLLESKLYGGKIEIIRDLIGATFDGYRFERC